MSPHGHQEARQQLFALISLIIGFVFALIVFLTLNFGLVYYSPVAFKQPYFPRGWLNYIYPCYRTFYPDVHNSDFKEWVAVVGDSYGEGQGDEFEDGVYNYGIFHKLRKRSHENYLIFARSGFGSINAAKELVACMDTMNRSLILPHIANPKKIIVLFYEGNDLNNNISYLRFKPGTQNIAEFVKTQIFRYSESRYVYEEKRSWHIYFPLYDILSSIIVNVTREAWHQIALARQALHQTEGRDEKLENRKKTTNNRVIVSNKIYEVRPEVTQSAAIELSGKGFDDALQVFFDSVLALKDKFSNSKLEIVYIPSVVTCYQWDGQISIETYQTNSQVITTTEGNAAQSWKIRQSIKLFSDMHNIGYTDPTSKLQDVAKNNLIHGPRNWKHFNAVGYRTLADAMCCDPH